MADEVKYILAPVEILRGVMDKPDLLTVRAEGLFRRTHGISIGIDIDDADLTQAMMDFDKIPKSRCLVAITYGMVQYVNKIVNSELVFEETKRSRIKTTVGYLALASICGRGGEWTTTNSKLFVARMAGYRNWKYFEAEHGPLSGGYNMMSKSTMIRHCNAIKKKIEETFDNVKFRPTKSRRGWEVTTNYKP